MKHPTRIGAIVSETPALSQLIQRARELQELDRTVGEDACSAAVMIGANEREPT